MFTPFYSSRSILYACLNVHCGDCNNLYILRICQKGYARSPNNIWLVVFSSRLVIDLSVLSAEQYIWTCLHPVGLGACQGASLMGFALAPFFPAQAWPKLTSDFKHGWAGTGTSCNSVLLVRDRNKDKDVHRFRWRISDTGGLLKIQMSDIRYWRKVRSNVRHNCRNSALFRSISEVYHLFRISDCLPPCANQILNLAIAVVFAIDFSI
jgi:hypothetical protein